jgi:hypothetical protein
LENAANERAGSPDSFKTGLLNKIQQTSTGRKSRPLEALLNS